MPFLALVTQPIILATHGQPLSVIFFSHLFRAVPLPLLSLDLSSSGSQNTAFCRPHQGASASQAMFSSVQLRRVRLFAIPWTAARQTFLSITNYQSLLKLLSIESVMPSNQFMLCCPLLLLPTVFPSIRVFSNELALPIRWTKYWSFSFSISPSSEYSGLISFRIDWFDLHAVPGTLKSLLQHHSSKAILRALSLLYGPNSHIHT